MTRLTMKAAGGTRRLATQSTADIRRGIHLHTTPKSLKKRQCQLPSEHRFLRSFHSTATISARDDPSTSSTSQAFDRSLKILQRNNAARATLRYRNEGEASDFKTTKTRDYYDYFRDEIATRLIDRLDDIKHEGGFGLALDVGSGAGHVYKAICADDALDGSGGIGGVRKLVQVDAADELLNRDANAQFAGQERCETYRLALDPQPQTEAKLPFPDGTFDLVTSCASFHWINDLPGLLREIHRVLKPDGCFLWAMVGGTTLPELRVALVLAEQERAGGVSPHVGPFCELQDVGSLLQSSGFALPTLDTDTVRLSFPHAGVLMEHVRRMGEGNASLRRRTHTGLDTFLATACLYDQMFPENTAAGDAEQAIEATVQVIYAIGWKPHESQQKPLQRGTATHRISEAVQHTKSDDGGLSSS